MIDNFKSSRDTMLEFMKGVLDGFFPKGSGLRWNDHNNKLEDIPSMSLPAGHSCPFAKDCRSCAIRNPRKRHDIGDRRKFIIQDGLHTQYRCYTAIDEVMRPTVRRARWHNYILLTAACSKGINEVIKLIEATLPTTKFAPFRIHVAGDFFHPVYFAAWLEITRRNPGRIFYAYTKALPYWVNHLGNIPKNFRLTASRGGTHDWMIEKYGLRSVKVFATVKEALEAGLEIDHDDSHAYGTGGDFAVLVHGQQPAGSIWAKAWSALKKVGMGGYGNQKAGLIAGSRSKKISAGVPPCP